MAEHDIDDGTPIDFSDLEVDEPKQVREKVEAAEAELERLLSKDDESQA